MNRVFRFVPIVLLVGSVVINVLLSTELRAAQSRSTPGLKVGTEISTIRVAATASRPARIVDLTGGEPTIFYHFSPSCGWCERNWDNIKTLVRDTSDPTGPTMRFVGLSIGKVDPKFLRDRGLSFDVIDDLPADVVKALSLGATPQTIVVSGNGAVLKTWFGAYSGTHKKSVEDFFKLTLPGLSAAPARKTAQGAKGE